MGWVDRGGRDHLGPGMGVGVVGGVRAREEIGRGEGEMEGYVSWNTILTPAKLT